MFTLNHTDNANSFNADDIFSNDTFDLNEFLDEQIGIDPTDGLIITEEIELTCEREAMKTNPDQISMFDDSDNNDEDAPVDYSLEIEAHETELDDLASDFESCRDDCDAFNVNLDYGTMFDTAFDPEMDTPPDGNYKELCLDEATNDLLNLASIVETILRPAIDDNLFIFTGRSAPATASPLITNIDPLFVYSVKAYGMKEIHAAPVVQARKRTTKGIRKRANAKNAKAITDADKVKAKAKAESKARQIQAKVSIVLTKLEQARKLAEDANTPLVFNGDWHTWNFNPDDILTQKRDNVARKRVRSEAPGTAFESTPLPVPPTYTITTNENDTMTDLENCADAGEYIDIADEVEARFAELNATIATLRHERDTYLQAGQTLRDKLNEQGEYIVYQKRLIANQRAELDELHAAKRAVEQQLEHQQAENDKLRQDNIALQDKYAKTKQEWVTAQHTIKQINDDIAMDGKADTDELTQLRDDNAILRDKRDQQEWSLDQWRQKYDDILTHPQVIQLREGHDKMLEKWRIINEQQGIELYKTREQLEAAIAKLAEANPLPKNQDQVSGDIVDAMIDQGEPGFINAPKHDQGEVDRTPKTIKRARTIKNKTIMGPVLDETTGLTTYYPITTVSGKPFKSEESARKAKTRLVNQGVDATGYYPEYDDPEKDSRVKEAGWVLHHASVLR